MLDPSIDPHLERALERVVDPELRRPITELGMVAGARIVDGVAEATVKLTIVGCPASERIQRDTVAALESVVGAGNARVALDVMTPEERQRLTDRLRPARAQQFGPDSLTRVFLITSGKGGVGKSTITVNLAVALARRGLKVGVIDADVYGFSVPGQLGISQQPTRLNDFILPPEAYGVQAISIGMFVGSEQAVSWRGPMLHRTLKQFLTDVYFGDLDVLLLDLPPGTGDVAISAGQLLPQAEVVVVTTPQEAASSVASRAGIVASQTGQRVAGVIENMSWLEVDGVRRELFGAGGGLRVSERLSTELDARVPLLGQVPISVPLREGADAGAPVVVSHPNDPAAVELVRLADALWGPGRGLAGRSLGLAPR